MVTRRTMWKTSEKQFDPFMFAVLVQSPVPVSTIVYMTSPAMNRTKFQFKVILL